MATKTAVFSIVHEVHTLIAGGIVGMRATPLPIEAGTCRPPLATASPTGAVVRPDLGANVAAPPAIEWIRVGVDTGSDVITAGFGEATLDRSVGITRSKTEPVDANPTGATGRSAVEIATNSVDALLKLPASWFAGRFAAIFRTTARGKQGRGCNEDDDLAHMAWILGRTGALDQGALCRPPCKDGSSCSAPGRA